MLSLPSSEMLGVATIGQRKRTPSWQVAISCWSTSRGERRDQNRELGHRGRRGDPRRVIRRVLLTGTERLNDRGVDRMALGLRLGDPNDEVLGVWLAEEYVRDVYLTEDPAEAGVLLDRVIVGCLSDEVPEIRSLGRTLKHWRGEILAHHAAGASNGPTEAMNLLVKQIKRCGHGFKSYCHFMATREIGAERRAFTSTADYI